MDSTLIAFLIVAGILIGGPALALAGAAIYRKVKDNQMAAGAYSEESEAEDEEFYQRSQCEAKLLELLPNTRAIADAEFIRSYRFLSKDFNRAHLLDELRSHNPHIVDLITDGDKFRVVLGPVGVKEVHELQRLEAERKEYEQRMECDEWPCHKPGHDEKHKKMREEADALKGSALIEAAKAAVMPPADDLRPIVLNLEIMVKDLSASFQDVTKKIADLTVPSPPPDFKVRELYRTMAHDKLVHAVKVLTKTMSPTHPHVIACRAEAEERVALGKVEAFVAPAPDAVRAKAKKPKKKTAKRKPASKRRQLRA